jgi:hypothetical protein
MEINFRSRSRWVGAGILLIKDSSFYDCTCEQNLLARANFYKQLNFFIAFVLHLLTVSCLTIKALHSYKKRDIEITQKISNFNTLRF